MPDATECNALMGSFAKARTHQGSRRGISPSPGEEFVMSDAERMSSLSYASQPRADSMPATIDRV